jgi:hypothetical protein
MSFNNVDSMSQTGDAGVSIDVTNPVHAAYAGAAVVGATVITGSVIITAVAAPGVVLIPAAVATGLCAYAHYENDRRNADVDASTTETAVS